jgi:hypothetical protein
MAQFPVVAPLEKSSRRVSQILKHQIIALQVNKIAEDYYQEYFL